MYSRDPLGAWRDMNWSRRANQEVTHNLYGESVSGKSTGRNTVYWAIVDWHIYSKTVINTWLTTRGLQPNIVNNQTRSCLHILTVIPDENCPTIYAYWFIMCDQLGFHPISARFEWEYSKISMKKTCSFFHQWCVSTKWTCCWYWISAW